MAWYQEWFGEEYLELYSHRDETEAREQVAFFRSQCGDIHGPILDLACGMGRHIHELTASGYQGTHRIRPHAGGPRRHAPPAVR